MHGGALEFDTRQLQRLHRRILVSEKHLENRIVAEAPLRLQLLYKLFERDVLTRVSFQAGFFRPRQQIEKSGVVREICTECERVYKKSDKRSHLSKVSACNWRPDYDVCLARITGHK